MNRSSLTHGIIIGGFCTLFAYMILRVHKIAVNVKQKYSYYKCKHTQTGKSKL